MVDIQQTLSALKHTSKGQLKYDTNWYEENRIDVRWFWFIAHLLPDW